MWVKSSYRILFGTNLFDDFCGAIIVHTAKIGKQAFTEESKSWL